MNTRLEEPARLLPTVAVCDVQWVCISPYTSTWHVGKCTGPIFCILLALHTHTHITQQGLTKAHAATI